MVLARRLHVENSWLAWIPIANLYLLTKMAKREWWFLLGFLIPYVNIFIAALLWSDIGVRLGKSAWVGALVVLPYIGVFVPGYLVIFSEAGGGQQSRSRRR